MFPNVHLTLCEKDAKERKADTRKEMGAFRLLLRSLHYVGLYIQLSVSGRQTGHGEMGNHISGNGTSDIR